MTTDRSQGASPDSNSGRLSVRLSPRRLSRLGSAVEDGPYHSRSHLVRAALELLLPPANDVRADGSGARRDGTSPTGGCSPDGIHVGTIHEVLPGGEQPARLAVEMIDERAGSPATHAFVYDADRSGRTAAFRTYDPPARLTHERIGSLGVLREAARSALEARNWQVDPSPGVEGSAGSTGPGGTATAGKRG